MAYLMVFMSLFIGIKDGIAFPLIINNVFVLTYLNVEKYNNNWLRKPWTFYLFKHIAQYDKLIIVILLLF